MEPTGRRCTCSATTGSSRSCVKHVRRVWRRAVWKWPAQDARASSYSPERASHSSSAAKRPRSQLSPLAESCEALAGSSGRSLDRRGRCRPSPSNRSASPCEPRPPRYACAAGQRHPLPGGLAALVGLRGAGILGLPSLAGARPGPPAPACGSRRGRRRRASPCRPRTIHSRSAQASIRWRSCDDQDHRALVVVERLHQRLAGNRCRDGWSARRGSADAARRRWRAPSAGAPSRRRRGSRHLRVGLRAAEAQLRAARPRSFASVASGIRSATCW